MFRAVIENLYLRLIFLADSNHASLQLAENRASAPVRSYKLSLSRYCSYNSRLRAHAIGVGAKG
jgi:hypothetical protein